MLGVTLVVLFGWAAAAMNIEASPIWRPVAQPAVPWCTAGETPTFRLGFAQLAQALGSRMGQPIECEHSAATTDDSLQRTTTGLAVYDWCTNTPRFDRGQEHWMLTQAGVEYWMDTDLAPPPRPLIVRAPNLRHPCTW